MSEFGSNPSTITEAYGEYAIQARAVSTNNRWDTVYRITKGGQTVKPWTKGNVAGLSDARSACQAGARLAKEDIDHGRISTSS